jgi:uncharacterized membrane protein
MLKLLITVLLVSLFFCGNILWADGHESVDDIEEIEEITDFIEVTQEKPGYFEIFGHLHPAMVHFPLAWMVLLFLVELIAFIENKASWHKAGFYILVITVISFIPAIISGLINASNHPPDTDKLNILLLHRNLNFIVVSLTLIALTLRFLRRKTSLGKLRVVYLALISIATILLLLSGHLGGKMVFGENYLPF